FAQPATLADCQTIQDRQARFACYDRWDAASGVVRESVPALPVQQERADVSAPQQDQPSLFSRIFHRGADDEPAAQAQVATASPPLENFGRSQGDARIVASTDGEFELVDRVAAL